MNRFILVLEILMLNLITFTYILIVISALKYEYVFYATISSVILLMVFQLSSKMLCKRSDYNSEYKDEINESRLITLIAFVVFIFGLISIVSFLMITTRVGNFMRLEILLTFVPYSIMIYTLTEEYDCKK